LCETDFTPPAVARAADLSGLVLAAGHSVSRRFGRCADTPAPEAGEMGGVTRPGREPTFCYVVRVRHKIVHGGIAADLARARAEAQARWPAGEVVQVGDGMTRQGAEQWARKNGYGT
jgi:hypothetical protein